TCTPMNRLPPVEQPCIAIEPVQVQDSGTGGRYGNSDSTSHSRRISAGNAPAREHPRHRRKAPAHLDGGTHPGLDQLRSSDSLRVYGPAVDRPQLCDVEIE